MMMKELDNRVTDNLDVTLWWDPVAEQVYVEVTDLKSDTSESAPVDPGDALDAFRHPFLYLRVGDEEVRV